MFPTEGIPAYPHIGLFRALCALAMKITDQTSVILLLLETFMTQASAGELAWIMGIGAVRVIFRFCPRHGWKRLLVNSSTRQLPATSQSTGFGASTDYGPKHDNLDSAFNIFFSLPYALRPWRSEHQVRRRVCRLGDVRSSHERKQRHELNG
jgi:hypothetical protein